MQDVIRAAIEDVLKEMGLPETDFVVEHPSDLSHGDYATNVAMAAGKVVGKSTRLNSSH